MTDIVDPFKATPATPEGIVDPFAPLPRPTQVAPAKPEKSGVIRRVVGDTAVDLGKGVVDLGEAAVGAADLVSGGHAGKALDAVGFDPDRAREAMGTLYSPERQQANQQVQDAHGFLPTLGAMLKNPSTIAGSVVESLPSMVGGGAGLARPLVTRALPLAERVAPGLAKVVPALAGGIGEGAVQAGQSAEQSRRTNEDRLLTGRQAGAAIGSGAVDALITTLGGATAQKLGIADVDTLLAGGKTAGGKLGMLKRALGGVVSEGVLEELPQSAQEQMWQNYATNKPLMEGVGEAAAQGVLAGAAMGGPVAALARPGSIKPLSMGSVRAPIKALGLIPEAARRVRKQAIDFNARPFQGGAARQAAEFAELSAKTAADARRAEEAERQRLAAMTQEAIEIEFGLTDADLEDLDLFERSGRKSRIK